VACPGGAGTISEIALALKDEKQVILFNTGHRDGAGSATTPAMRARKARRAGRADPAVSGTALLRRSGLYPQAFNL
jgi:hypothetical protein